MACLHSSACPGRHLSISCFRMEWELNPIKGALYSSTRNTEPQRHWLV
ncbi:hypothetical protein MXB_1881 [Myxobolus squamalis]|nr:hypothetical protein MXB_1881 [Myxobolus squamalis]